MPACWVLHIECLELVASGALSLSWLRTHSLQQLDTVKMWPVQLRWDGLKLLMKPDPSGTFSLAVWNSHVAQHCVSSGNYSVHGYPVSPHLSEFRPTHTQLSFQQHIQGAPFRSLVLFLYDYLASPGVWSPDSSHLNSIPTTVSASMAQQGCTRLGFLQVSRPVFWTALPLLIQLALLSLLCEPQTTPGMRGMSANEMKTHVRLKVASSKLRPQSFRSSEYMKNYWTMHFKRVHFIVLELYLKDVNKIRCMKDIYIYIF